MYSDVITLFCKPAQTLSCKISSALCMSWNVICFDSLTYLSKWSLLINPSALFSYPLCRPSTGYNVTVLGYGQRGSGKTYTLTGPDFLWAMNEEEFGLLPQAVRHIFNLMRVWCFIRLELHFTIKFVVIIHELYLCILLCSYYCILTTLSSPYCMPFWYTTAAFHFSTWKLKK